VFAHFTNIIQFLRISAMLLPPDRLEHYKTSLEQQLKRLASSIRSYLVLKAADTSELSNRANRLWELSQRYRLVKG